MVRLALESLACGLPPPIALKHCLSRDASVVMIDPSERSATMLPSGGRSTGHGGHRYGRSVQSRPVPASAACTSYPSPLPKTWLRLGGLVTRTLPHWRLLSLPTAHRHAPNTIVKRVAVQRRSWRIERASLWSTITARMRTMVRLSTFLLASACCGKADGVPSSGETGHSTLEGGIGESNSSGGTDTAAAPRDASAGGDSAGSPLHRNVTQVSVGGNATCALLRDGTAKCWGYNAAGELGIAPGTPWSSTPVVVQGLSHAVQISAGFRHTCAVLGDGTAQCWGWNDVGQLGNGTTTNASAPVVALGLSGVAAIAAGDGNPKHFSPMEPFGYGVGAHNSSQMAESRMDSPPSLNRDFPMSSRLPLETGIHVRLSATGRSSAGALTTLVSLAQRRIRRGNRRSRTGLHIRVANRSRLPPADPRRQHPSP